MKPFRTKPTEPQEGQQVRIRSTNFKLDKHYTYQPKIILPLIAPPDNGVKTTRVSVYSTWPDETIKIRKIAENMFENHTAIPNADSTSPISDDSENNFRKPESLSSPASNELNSFSAGTAEKTL